MLKIALTKGRVEEQFTALLAQRGFDTSPLENKQRRLIIEVADQFEFILAKGPDVLTYLTNGVVDLGIVGSDILMEQDAESDELLDLKTGQCQFILASTEDFDPDRPGRKVIGTKYPRVAQRYFARPLLCSPRPRRRHHQVGGVGGVSPLNWPGRRHY